MTKFIWPTMPPSLVFEETKESINKGDTDQKKEDDNINKGDGASKILFDLFYEIKNKLNKRLKMLEDFLNTDKKEINKKQTLTKDLIKLKHEIFEAESEFHRLLSIEDETYKGDI